MNIVEEIGLPAVMEQTAEECSELAQACLKIARKLRGENPTPKGTEELWESFHEELADVTYCIEVLDEVIVIDAQKILDMQDAKAKRWKQRISEHKCEHDESDLIKPFSYTTAEDVKIGRVTFKAGTTVYRCAACNSFITRGFNYCPDCGQRINWR